MKVVINTCYGGFSVSQEAYDMLQKLGYEGPLGARDICRHDEHLIDVIQKLGEDADGPHAELKIIEIPDGVDYIIEEYDGAEWVAERHRTWS